MCSSRLKATAAAALTKSSFECSTLKRKRGKGDEVTGARCIEALQKKTATKREREREMDGWEKSTHTKNIQQNDDDDGHRLYDR